MANLQQIKTDSNWGAEAPRINENFNAVNTELSKLSVVTNIKMPMFKTTSEATSQLPNKYVGQLVFISSDYTLPAPIYRWNGTSWTNTGKTGGNASIPVSDYLLYSDVKSVNDIII